jgi:WD40-like Beta Propeller Repeat
MTLNPRILCAMLGLGLVALISANPSATPPFSSWSIPVDLGPDVNSVYDEGGPAISKDGLSLYFNSDRPGGFGNQDIWVSQRSREDEPWSPAQNLGPTVNTAGLEAIPAFSRDGHWMFFNSNRGGGFGQIDLWASYRAHVHDNFGWETPVNLGSNINTAFIDAGASFLENDEGGPSVLFFVSTRPGGFGSFDIYRSFVTDDGTLGPAAFVPELSSPASDQRPSVRFDGLEIFLSSNRADTLGDMDLWVSTRDDLSAPWSPPVNLGSVVNTAAADNYPYIDARRQHLYFGSNRAGGLGGFDLYVTTRTKLHGHGR